MNVIKFSHDYPKLWGQKHAKLLTIEPLRVPEDLTPELKEYDTKTVDGTYYPLADGIYMQLIFLGNLGVPFCTIRRQTMNKIAYYNERVGQWFDVVIEGVNEPNKINPQELANALGMYVMVDIDGIWFASTDKPVIGYDTVKARNIGQTDFSPNYIFVQDCFNLQYEISERIEYIGDWKDSLFIPDVLDGEERINESVNIKNCPFCGRKL